MDRTDAEKLLTEHGYTASGLVMRAMANMKPRKGRSCPRWMAVMDTFGTGSTLAQALCVAQGYKPEEKITR